MHSHLNGWQRVGILASVLWVIGGGIAVRNADLRSASSMYRLTDQICTEAEHKRPNYDLSICSKKADEAFETMLKGSWGNVALVSFLPLPLGWLMAYLVIGIWGWVKRGFKTPSPH